MGKLAIIHPLNRAGAILACALALTVGGCGSDDIQFNGGLFDMVGLSDEAKAKNSHGDPKMAERAPLVVPPSMNHLPPPGEGQTAPDGQVAGVRDVDATKAESQAELERKQVAYCKINYDDAKMRGDESTALNAAGPLGPCRPSVLNSIKKWNASDSGDAGQ
jgi:hypothetical protein